MLTPWCNRKRGGLAGGIALSTLFTAVLVCAMAVLWLGVAWAQPVSEWSTTVGGDGDDFAHSVALTSDGGFVIAGETRSYGSGSQDGWLVKLNSDGEEQWSRTFGGAESDIIYSVQTTIDGGFVLAGETHSAEGATAASSHFWLIKTDSQGSISGRAAMAAPRNQQQRPNQQQRRNRNQHQRSPAIPTWRTRCVRPATAATSWSAVPAELRGHLPGWSVQIRRELSCGARAWRIFPEAWGTTLRRFLVAISLPGAQAQRPGQPGLSCGDGHNRRGPVDRILWG